MADENPSDENRLAKARKPGKMVRVKCIVKNQPWVNDSPMEFLEIREVTEDDALLLVERDHVTLLEDK